MVCKLHAHGCTRYVNGDECSDVVQHKGQHVCTQLVAGQFLTRETALNAWMKLVVKDFLTDIEQPYPDCCQNVFS